MYVHLLYINSTQNSPAFQNDWYSFLFCAPETIPQTQKWTLCLLERDSKKLILSLILKGVTSTGGGHRTWGHNYSTMGKDAGF